MISVKKDFNDIPITLRNIPQPTVQGSSKCKFQKDVKQKLNSIYHNKCAYCEAEHPLEIEHYRPKGKVSGDNEHNGYFWLTYEWSNLLLACSGCNSGEDAKGTKFPLAMGGKRIYSPQKDPSQWVSNSETFLNEKPLLLNPEIDTPEDHLEFLFNGAVKELNGSIRGEKTISICNLNRERLWLTGRKKRIDDIFRDIKLQTYELKKKYGTPAEVDKKDYSITYKTIFKNIKERRSPGNEFSRVYFYFYENFDEFLEKSTETELVAGSWKKIIKEAFAMFKQGVL